MSTRLSDKAAAALDRVVARFRDGDLSDIVTVAWIKRDPSDSLPASRWTLQNCILAYAQTGTLDCRGYRQWQAAGRQVQRGASAAYILGPCTYTTETEDGEKVTRLRGFTSIPVFPVFATEGEEQPAAIDYTPDPDALPPLLDVAAALGISVDWVPLVDSTSALGAHLPGLDKILLGSADPSVFFHELAHALHKRTCAGDPTREQKETVAEFTACVLSWLYGAHDTTGNAWQYIEHYNPADPLSAVMAALADVAHILEALESLQNAIMAPLS